MKKVFVLIVIILSYFAYKKHTEHAKEKAINNTISKFDSIVDKFCDCDIGDFRCSKMVRAEMLDWSSDIDELVRGNKKLSPDKKQYMQLASTFLKLDGCSKEWAAQGYNSRFNKR